MTNTGSDLPKVTIVVLSWNGFEDTVECVESLLIQSYPDYQILIVDNGSTDGSEERLREKFPSITVIQTGKNLGYAGGMNAGIRFALKSGADLVTLLNNDTVVDPSFTTGLVKAARGDKEAGILCSKIYFYDNRKVIWYAGASFNSWLGWGRHRGYNEPDKNDFNVLGETPRPCGCAMMVTREFVESAGLLDEELFCYFEDADLGLRAGSSGFKVLYVPGSIVYHKVSRSTGGVSTSLSLYYCVRNTLRSLDKNKPLPPVARQIRWAVIIAINIMSLFTLSIPKTLGLKRIFSGFNDYLRGRFGELKE